MGSRFSRSRAWTRREEINYINTESKTNGAVSHISIDGVSKTIKSLSEVKEDKRKIIDNLPQDLVRYL